MTLAKKIYIALLIVGLAVIIIISRNDKESRVERLGSVLSLHCERISNQIQRAVYATEVLKEVTSAGKGELEFEGFNALAHAVGEGINYVVIQAMPNGIVQYAYPLLGNEQTIGHDVLSSESTAVEAQMAMEKNEIVISGPFSLMQGSKGLAIRNPLYLENEEGSYFWGFIAIVLPVPDALNDTGVFELENLGYQYEIIAQYKGEDIVFAATSRFNKEFAITKPIVIGDNNWSMSMYRESDITEAWVIFLLRCATLLLLATAIYFVLKRVERRLNNDLLTGALNRRLLESYIKPKHFSNTPGFTLFYIDLNEFKPVNDTHGHEMGDRLLIAYVKRLQGNIKSDGTIYRVGGDEFVVIIPNLKTNDSIKEVTKRVASLSKKPFVINGKTLAISASIGAATFPTDGEDLKTLLKIADEHMYADKQAYKKARNATR